jgi:hypothetical protein
MRLHRFLIALSFCTLVLAQEGPAARPCTISGSVVRAADGKPIARAKVQLDGDRADTLTDDEGGYSFRDIECSSHTVTASRAGYLSTQFGQRSPFGSGAPIVLKGGGRFTAAIIRLSAAAVITGRISDQDGEPLSSTTVSALRAVWRRGKHKLEAVATENTNDLGEYRLHGLAAGGYYVVAGSGGFGSGFGYVLNRFVQESAPPTAPRMVRVATYYPGTTDESQATPIEVRAGEEARVDITQQQVRAMKVRGRVVGVPKDAHAAVMLISSGSFGQANAEPKADGSFEIEGVAPGKYIAVAFAMPLDFARAPDENKMRRGSTTVQVADTDVDGVTITLGGAQDAEGATVRGRISARGGSLDYRKLIVAAIPEDLDRSDTGEMMAMALIGGRMSMGYDQPKADGTFEFKNVAPGKYRVGIQAQDGSMREWYTEAAHVGNVDVLTSGLRITGAAAMPPLEILVNAGGAQVDGLVVDKEGKPLPGVTVTGIPAPPLRRQPDLYQTETTDQSGHFTIRGQRPGEYTFLALDGIEGQEFYDPEFLAKYESQGKRVELHEREKVTLQLAAVAPGEPQ